MIINKRVCNWDYKCTPENPHPYCGYERVAIRCDICDERIGVTVQDITFAYRHLGWLIFAMGNSAKCPKHCGRKVTVNPDV